MYVSCLPPLKLWLAQGDGGLRLFSSQVGSECALIGWCMPGCCAELCRAPAPKMGPASCTWLDTWPAEGKGTGRCFVFGRLCLHQHLKATSEADCTCWHITAAVLLPHAAPSCQVKHWLAVGNVQASPAIQLTFSPRQTERNKIQWDGGRKAVWHPALGSWWAIWTRSQTCACSAAPRTPRQLHRFWR